MLLERKADRKDERFIVQIQGEQILRGNARKKFIKR
jgi:hypothetical protein